MNNAIYRKTTEDVRNRISVQLAKNEKEYLKCDDDDDDDGDDDNDELFLWYG